MRYRRAVFIIPTYPGQHFIQRSPSIGIGYLSEVLRRAGVEVTALDAGGLCSGELRAFLQDAQPDLIGVSMMTFRYEHHYALVRDIKTIAPQASVVAGGPHVSLFGKRVLEDCLSLDLAIEGEGEVSLRQLCEGEELDAISGLHYRTADRIRSGRPKEYLKDLDAIPFPTYDGFRREKIPVVSLCSSRGCPFRCTFCQSTSLGKAWRARSPKSIGEELEYWHRRGQRVFDFIDDNLTFDKDRMYSICDEIQRRGLGDLAMGAAGVRADRVDRELLVRMKEVGFRHLGFGVEGGNDRILEILRKGERFIQIDDAVRISTELGYGVTLYFLVGSPHETLGDVEDSCRFALKYPVSDAFFSNLMPIPGSELMEWVLQNGRLLRPSEEYLNDTAEFERVPLFEAPGMTYEERVSALAMTDRVRGQVRTRFAVVSAARQAKTLLAPFDHAGFLGKAVQRLLEPVLRRILTARRVTRIKREAA